MGEEEIAPIEAKEVDFIEGMVKEMLVQKSQDEQATKREKAPLKTTPDEVRIIIAPIREM